MQFRTIRCKFIQFVTYIHLPAFEDFVPIVGLSHLLSDYLSSKFTSK